MKDNNLKVLIVSSEAIPYAKSGGLGDVAGSLPKELLKRGVDVRVVLPGYKTIGEARLKGAEHIGSYDITLGWRKQSASALKTDAAPPVYLIQNDYYFGRDGYYGYGDDYERFAFFSKAAIELLALIGFRADIIHINDWQTGLLPVYLKDSYARFLFFSEMKTLFTVHNLQYQGSFGKDVLNSIDLNSGYANPDKLEFHGNINYMKAGLTYSDAVNTVSSTYMSEIQTSDYGYGMDGILRSINNRLFGITNGIDTDINNPETDKNIYETYSARQLDKKVMNKLGLQAHLKLPERPDVPVFSIISRLVDQKGLDLVAGIMDELMQKDVQLVVLGTGDGKFEHMFYHLQEKYPDKVSANILFDAQLSQKIYAGSDIFLMPSLFEPCGLGQMISMRYGAVPIVRETGGLADTVKHFDGKNGTGFVFKDYLLSGLMWAINAALDVYYDKKLWAALVKNAMAADNSWKKSAGEYLKLYKRLINPQ